MSLRKETIMVYEILTDNTIYNIHEAVYGLLKCGSGSERKMNYLQHIISDNGFNLNADSRHRYELILHGYPLIAELSIDEHTTVEIFSLTKDQLGITYKYFAKDNNDMYWMQDISIYTYMMSDDNLIMKKYHKKIIDKLNIKPQDMIGKKYGWLLNELQDIYEDVYPIFKGGYVHGTQSALIARSIYKQL